MGKEWDGQAIREAAERDRATRKSLGPASPSRPGRTEPRSSSAFGNEAIIAGPVRGGADFQAWCERWATEALRVLKPGGHLLAFGGTRTYHRLACAVEDAGFEIRDSLIWLQGSGFPKSLDVGKAIDKAAGAEREVVGESATFRPSTRENGTDGMRDRRLTGDLTAPATPEAEQWQGWGTALKPAHEPIVVARKPLIGTVAQTVLEHGTGALNVDGCRIEASAEDQAAQLRANTPGAGRFVENEGTVYGRWAPAQCDHDPSAGRWPANVVLSHLPECEQVGTRRVKSGTAVNRNRPAERSRYDASNYEIRMGPGEDATYADPDGTETVTAWRCQEGCPVAELDRQSGERGIHGAGSAKPPGGWPDSPDGMFGIGGGEYGGARYGDTGAASRFFYVAKASRSERNAGLRGEAQPVHRYGAGIGEGDDPMAPSMDRNVHPTVKPLALMRWLVRLVTPPGGTVLDPFAGSGTTGAAAVLEGFNFIGVEREAEYAAIAEARIAFWEQFPGADVDAVLISDSRTRAIEATGQESLL